MKVALSRLVAACRRQPLYSYKVDVSNYFNSIPVRPLLKMLHEFLNDEPLYRFFENQLTDRRVDFDGEIIEEDKGVMAGTPTAAFLANVYLMDLDGKFSDEIYARYSDDIILFAPSKEELDEKKERLLSVLSEKGLTVNPEKVNETAPQDPWTFLGITYQNGETDICDVSVQKLKDKLRRKSRSLLRWKRRKGATNA